MYRYFSFVLFLQINLAAQAQPSIIAHRGSSFTAPENTVAAAQLAWQQNADAVELDIYLSKDNRVVVIHDSNTKRTTGQEFNVAETSADVLRSLDAGDWKNELYKGEKIPFLEEMIATIPDGKKMVIEIKCGVEVLPALKLAVDLSGKKQQLIFIAFGWETILATKQLFPENACYWLSGWAPEVQEKMKESAIKGLDGLNLNNKIVDKKTVRRAKRLGLEMLSWTIDDAEEAKRLVKLGVTGITTNRPDLIRSSLQ
ncbi:MAG: glycerophosphodiester phosphodiesterase family protein [Bacteroidota bacterium]|nr:glycerophosphodiester phosphodiesterase [Odoribacter sp.]MDP3644180.1 glycerophosphodiester phosphodiesterase family protein [Bacteroidota bacterium]